MGNRRAHEEKGSQMEKGQAGGLPSPSTQFRIRAWREFQKALDPLAPPKPLPKKRYH